MSPCCSCPRSVTTSGLLEAWAYGQTFLLSLTAHGLGGIPQTMLGFYADTIREGLGGHPSLKLLFGISFGYPDKTSPANNYRIGKAPITDSVTLHA